MKHIFIVNPAAGKGDALKLIPQIEKAFAGREDDFVIKITEGPGHAEIISKFYSNKELCRLYSVGGDGTLNEVLNGMAESGCSLAVIPCGSGNDFARGLGNFEFQNILERTIDGSIKIIDAAKVNGRYFINIASVGFDAEVVYNAKRLKRIPLIASNIAYLLSIFITIFRYGGCNLNVNIDGKKLNKKFLLAAIANGKYYGGGMLPAPDAKIDDGLIDICLIDAVGKLKILAFFPRLIKGTHKNMKEVMLLKGKRVEIASDVDISLNIDGELLREKRAVFEVLPDALNIVVPS